MPIVKIESTGRTLVVPDNANLREAMLREGARLYDGVRGMFNCGGKGECGTCAVRVLEGASSLSPPTPLEKQRAPAAAEGMRLACQANVRGDCRIDPTDKRLKSKSGSA